MLEGADEIERLRADNARLRRELAMLSAAGGVVIGGPPGAAAMVKLP